jgi:hypothetical protein
MMVKRFENQTGQAIDLSQKTDQGLDPLPTGMQS